MDVKFLRTFAALPIISSYSCACGKFCRGRRRCGRRRTIVFNPPYGARMGSADKVRMLYNGMISCYLYQYFKFDRPEG